MKAASASGRTFIWLDVARALAAAIVLAGHLRAFVFTDSVASGHLSAAWKAFYFVTSMQHQAVIVFFVLSGFLISRTISEQAESRTWSWRSYAIKRFSRLWIVLLPALVLTWVWDRLGMHLTGSPLYSGALNTVNHSTPIGTLSYSPWTFIGNAFFLQSIAVPAFGTDVPLWSLANEFWYYVVFPLFFFAFRPIYRTAPRIALFVLAMILCIWVLPAQLMLGFVWLMGYGAYLLERRFGRSPHRTRVYAAGVSLLIFLAVLIESKLVKLEDVTQDFITGAAFTLLLVAVAGLNAPDVLARPARVFAGFSYTLYVMHFPFLAFLTSTLTRNLRVAPGLQGLMTFTILFIVVMVYAYAISFVFERNTPAIQYVLMRGLRGIRLAQRPAAVTLRTE